MGVLIQQAHVSKTTFLNRLIKQHLFLNEEVKTPSLEKLYLKIIFFN